MLTTPNDLQLTWEPVSGTDFPGFFTQPSLQRLKLKSFLPFLKTGVMFTFFQTFLPWLSQPFNDRITSKLHGPTPVLLTGTPWTQASHLFKCFLACFSSLTQSFPSISGTWDCWKLIIPVKKDQGWDWVGGHTFTLQCSFCARGTLTAGSCKSKLLNVKNDKSIGVSQEWFPGGWPSVLAFILGRFSELGRTSCVLILVMQVSFTHHCL